MKEANMPQWKLGKLLNKSENTVNRMLREELPEAEQNRIIEIIQEYARKSGEQSA